MTRARTDVDAIEADLVRCMQTLREALKPVDGTPEDEALAAVETTLVIALRVFRKTNPSKIRDEARTVEIKARMDGRQVLEGLTHA